MNAPSFSSILDRAASDIEPPKQLPAGAYLCVVKGLPRFDKSTKKGTDYAEFTLQPLQYLEDDQEPIDDLGGLSERTLRATFYITEDAVYRLKDFLELCGIESEGKSLTMMINESPNCQIIANVGHRPSPDGTRIFADIKSFARAE